MDTKELFQQEVDEEGGKLSLRLQGATQSRWFLRCLAFADSIALEEGLSAEEMNGIRRYKRILLDMPEITSDEVREIPGPGLNHHIVVEPKSAFKKETK